MRIKIKKKVMLYIETLKFMVFNASQGNYDWLCKFNN